MQVKIQKQNTKMQVKIQKYKSKIKRQYTNFKIKNSKSTFYGGNHNGQLHNENI